MPLPRVAPCFVREVCDSRWVSALYLIANFRGNHTVCVARQWFHQVSAEEACRSSPSMQSQRPLEESANADDVDLELEELRLQLERITLRIATLNNRRASEAAQSAVPGSTASSALPSPIGSSPDGWTQVPLNPAPSEAYSGPGSVAAGTSARAESPDPSHTRARCAAARWPEQDEFARAAGQWVLRALAGHRCGVAPRSKFPGSTNRVYVVFAKRGGKPLDPVRVFFNWAQCCDFLAPPQRGAYDNAVFLGLHTQGEAQACVACAGKGWPL